MAVHSTEQSNHRLAPLLTPKSIALVGASPRPGSIGNATARTLLSSVFAGPISMINPRHNKVEGQPCLAGLGEIDNPPDLAILNVGATRIENTLCEAIDAGARSAIIYDACHGATDTGAPLLDRLRDIAREADLPICGGNGMGLFNLTDRVHASFYTATHLKPGGITLIAHSGSVFTVLGLNDSRYRFDLMVSPGQEIGASIDQYVTFAVSRPTTKVVAMFMEQARDPRAFIAALEAAQLAGTPVVVCKVGRTDASAALARSHSGAIAGSADGYDAVLERYGAISVETVDQLMNTALVLSCMPEMGPGELATVTDSGGLRELFIDRAHSRNLPLAELSDETRERLKQILPANLPPSNPLDCAGAINDEFVSVFENGFKVLADAPEVACMGLEIDARDDFTYDPGLVEFALNLQRFTDKPAFVYSCFANANNRAFADKLMDAGLPLLNGLDETLSVVNALRKLRELLTFHATPDLPPKPPSQTTVAESRKKLAGSSIISEAQGLTVLADFDIPTVPFKACDNWDDVAAAAQTFGFPAVLKTATPGIEHKSDVGGVAVGLRDQASLKLAHDEMTTRLGPDVIVQPMAPAGIELAFGAVVDPDFGPMVMVSAGGTLIEFLADRQVSLAPFGKRRAKRMLQSLKLYPVLQGARGRPACNLDALVDALAAFSVLSATLADHFTECDVNPVIANEEGVIAVDALFVTPDR